MILQFIDNKESFLSIHGIGSQGPFGSSLTSMSKITHTSDQRVQCTSFYKDVSFYFVAVIIVCHFLMQH